MTANARPPTGLELTPLDDAYRENPHAVYARLREREPVHFDRFRRAWVVTTHAEVRELLRDRSLSVHPRSIGRAADLRPDSPIPEREPGLLGLDDPKHQRLRALVGKAFTPRSVELLRERIETVVDRVIDAIEDRGAFDAMREFAAQVPVIVIAELMGAGADDPLTFRRWTEVGMKQLYVQPTEEQWRAAAAVDAEQRAFFADLIAAKRRSPGDDLVSRLIAARDTDDLLSEDEIVTNCVLFMGAGNFTTTDLIGNGLLALLEHPDELRKLRRRPDLMPNAIEEMLRYDGPVIQVSRFTTRDLDVAGTRVPAPSTLHLIVTAANRDPAAHADPDRLDVERSPIDHLAFGIGNHLCIGAPLARLEAQIAIRKLLDAFPALDLAPEGAKRRPVVNFRGCSRLPVVTGL